MTHRRLFSVVSAVYNAERYIDDFLESLKKQTYPFHLLDIVLVDDGSTDGSLRMMQEWQRKHPRQIRVVTGRNGGPGAARNRGLDVVHNPWVTFCDPDDVLHPAYFAKVEGFIRRDRAHQAAAVTGRLIQYFEATGERRDTHALAWKFLGGERVVDLNAEPHYIHLSAGTVFLRRSVLNEFYLRFDERIRPTFEDAHLVARYLECCRQPTVGLVPEAVYYYRQRAEGTSLAQSGWASAQRYTSVLEYGYLDLLRHFYTRHGSVPRWAQNTVLYDIMWYFLADRAMRHPIAGIGAALRADLMNRLQEVMSFIDAEAILQFAIIPVSVEIRTAIALRFKGPLPYVWYRETTGTANRYQYFYRGPAPSERYLDGANTPLHPTVAKRIAVEFFGEVFAYQRVVYFPGNEQPRCELGGAVLDPIPRPGPPQARYLKKLTAPQLRLPPTILEHIVLRTTRLIPYTGIRRRIQSKVRRTLHPPLHGIITDAPVAVAQRATDDALKALAQTQAVRDRYEDAWLIMDRPEHGFDNGEHFYRYVRDNHPEINAWFVLHLDSPDWPRLLQDGFRLIAYGSDELVLLALNASFRISSDAALPSYFPIDRKRFGGGNGRFVFLQHGVIWNDLSRWLNDKRIDRFIATTPSEYAALTGDGSVYAVTAQEVRLTGMARFDSLHKRAKNHGEPPVRPKTIVVMPTWRMNLAESLERVERQQTRLDVVLASRFFREWNSFITSERLRLLLTRNGLRVAFFVHPSLASVLPAGVFPEYVDLYPQPGVSLHDLLLESAAFVTDYSSTAFDAAYIDLDVMYFQFDADTFLYGDHPARPGYFDYHRDGFGPVADTVEGLLHNLESWEANGFAAAEDYTERITRTFAYRDAGNCARIFESILELEKG